MDLAGELRAVEPQICTSPWPDHEHVRGYAVMVLPFSSGHLLGLRVWPENDFAPYVSVWHGTPEGDWSMYSDGPICEAACQRYWGPVTRHTGPAAINVSWTGPSALRVEMDDPPLLWTMTRQTNHQTFAAQMEAKTAA